VAVVKTSLCADPNFEPRFEDPPVGAVDRFARLSSTASGEESHANAEPGGHDSRGRRELAPKLTVGLPVRLF